MAAASNRIPDLARRPAAPHPRFDAGSRLDLAAGRLRIAGAAGPLDFTLEDGPEGLSLHAPDTACAGALRAAVEALSAQDRARRPLRLGRAGDELRAAASRRGYLRGDLLSPSAVWQDPGGWLTDPRPPYPFAPAFSAGRVHPLRPAKPTGELYRRFIPWMGADFTLRAADPVADLPLFHAWMNEPAVARIWEDHGDLSAHAQMIAARCADPHMLPAIGAMGGRDFAWFELYWAAEDRIGPHAHAAPYDRGWHVAIGEHDCRGRAWVTAWLPSLMHFIFLDDPRTMTILGEPRADHAQQIRNLDKAGFSKVKEFDFPHKRALLVALLRERFFEDRLWAPEAASASAHVHVPAGADA